MTEAKKVLKEGSNKVTVVGTLVEKNLEEKSYTNSQTGETVEQIVGTISVRTGENEVHQVRLRSNKFSKKGKVYSLYKEYLKVRNEYISQADVAEAAQNGIELVADVVSVNGKLRPFQQINGVSIKRIEDKEQHFQANFEAKIKIDRALVEVGSEGEVTIEAEVIDNNPFNLTFLSPIEAAEFFLEYDLRGKLKVGGEILSKTKCNKYVAEFLINNGALLYED
ncbi:hypothetical protein [Psychrobacillus sp. BM2]|uniref:hypothetical protein n=1 Tax=Psychrobacillus sp. BM2 TaxID=3400421 RepID=UPI003B01E558